MMIALTEEDTTVEPQYKRCLDVQREFGATSLGIMSNQTWHDDPKRLTFLLARYKFVAKMLQGRSNTLEIGCADAFGTRIVQQTVPSVSVLDIDPLFIEDVKARMDPKWPMDCLVHNVLTGPTEKRYESIFSLDVLEHIRPADEDLFVGNLVKSLSPEGALIVGSPSIHSQPYASPPSREGHVNCKDYSGMKALFEKFFHNVFVFSMNDEVVHTGFEKMSNYFLVLACTIRR